MIESSAGEETAVTLLLDVGVAGAKFVGVELAVVEVEAFDAGRRAFRVVLFRDLVDFV